ncbi:MOSC domain-containing protein [Zavarzinia compransoris]|uniref:MOSC domain-containing protein n=1 Tax=Zavarzinia compransoris TaxID=1264899 RepID=A0A317ECH2_9PROT|nr:MOSC domain-containing protein [Zavarzinia compransoris]PWR23976.1 MOSC domain-containing protein [Zavarzinia compransoris]TDP48230.1 MOSC domain-containing protein YiiM [Zavarzinia compransoris]
MTVAITHLLTGRLAPLGPRAVPSGIDKQPVDGPRRLTRTGFAGDAQGDLRHHGGPDKAVHHYPFDHYAAWAADLGPLPRLGRAGAFGENLSSLGLTEAGVAVGDVFRLGGAVLEVSQGRQPCWKLNLRFGVADMARRVQASGRTGWYYRVIEDGMVAPGDALALLDRRAPAWSLTRLWRILYVDVLDRDELAAMAAEPLLPAGWRHYAEKRLAAGAVEDWRSRLEG